MSLTSLYSVSFRRKRHDFIAGIGSGTPAEHGLCSWKINQHKTDVNSSVNILYSLLHFKGSLSPCPTFRVEENFFGLQTSAGHVLSAKAIGLSGYDCMQNINWKWGSAGFLRNLTRKDQQIWKEPTARKSEIIRNMEPEKYSNNTKTTAYDGRRLSSYTGEQTLMYVFNTRLK